MVSGSGLAPSMSRAGKLLVPLLLAQGAMSAEEHACSVDADCDSWEADSPGPILNGVAGCVDDGEYGCQAGRWMNRSCQRGRCMWEPSCRKDHHCIITQICNEDRRCVPGVQGCVEDLNDPDNACHRTTQAREEPSVVAQDLNAAFDSETSGVLIHVLDGATEQTQHYKFCENSLDPGCSAAGGSGGRRRLPETSGGFYDKPPVCGRTAFSVVNKLAWSEEEQQLQGPWAHEETGLEVVGDEVEPPSPLIIATDVMLQTATCMFPGDAKPGRRTANGCGRSVSATCATPWSAVPTWR